MPEASGDQCWRNSAPPGQRYLALRDEITRRRVGRNRHCRTRPMSQIRVQRVIADVERAAGLALVAAVLLENVAGIPAAPGPHGVAALIGRHQMLGVLSAQADWKIVNAN